MNSMLTLRLVVMTIGVGAVCVQMDTFSVADKVTYDASGRVVSAEGKEFDPESQQISDEFKHQPY